MPLDFTLLSMTELRNRPGEIFDRVANDGEAFIIEKGGQRKACLVPLSVFFPDVAPSRIAQEIEQLEKNGEQSRVEITEKKELALRFDHSLRSGTSVEVEVVLPHRYPNACPRVYANPITSGAPHRWNDGALCIYGVMSGWNPGKHTVLSTLKLARQWLQHYEVWQETGQWPKLKEAPDAR
jgi:ubiquitin-protein ligase